MQCYSEVEKEGELGNLVPRKFLGSQKILRKNGCTFDKNWVSKVKINQISLTWTNSPYFFPRNNDSHILQQISAEKICSFPFSSAESFCRKILVHLFSAENFSKIYEPFIFCRNVVQKNSLSLIFLQKISLKKYEPFFPAEIFFEKIWAIWVIYSLQKFLQKNYFPLIFYRKLLCQNMSH